MRLIGDGRVVGNGDCYHQALSIPDAQYMANILCICEGLPSVDVIPGRKAKRRHGFMNIKTRTMTLNKPSEGIVLHELSHLNNIYKYTGHKKGFKDLQARLYIAWYGAR